MLILLVPIMSWLAAQIFMGSDLVNLPADLTRPVTIRYVNVSEIDKIIADFNVYTSTRGLLTGQIFFTFIFLFVGFGILSFIYAILYRLVGPPRYGPFDVPPSSMRR